MSGQSGRARRRVRTQWLALGAALVVLAGVMVAWALSNAADRVQVVQIAHLVEAGDLIGADDLTVAAVAFDDVVTGLMPISSSAALVGRVAAIDLQAGVLLQSGMWHAATQIAPGEQSVGALLQPGHFPDGLARGDVALAAPVDAGTATVPISVRVLEVQPGPNGELSVTLAVPAAQSIAVAQLAAHDGLLLVGQPPSDAPATAVEG